MKKNLILLAILISLGVCAWLAYSQSKPSSMSDRPLSEFAIKDTAAINKIIITDQFGKSAKLERVPGQKLWKLNDKYLAREDAVDLLLVTFYRISIRGNVSDNARDNMMRLIATAGKRVEIFMGGEKPAKIYYVGVPTPDHTGTHMLLEIPGIGRSEDPYITHMEDFTGFLSTRFFTDEKEWRYTGVFEYPQLDFTRVDVIHHYQPELAFSVRYTGGNNIELFDGYDPSSGSFNHKEEQIDSSAVRNFLLLFKKAHVESFNTQLKPESADSIMKTMPAYTIAVTDSKGQVNKVDLFLKRATKAVYDEQGNLNPWDVSYFWAETKDGDLGLGQTYTFEPMIYPVQAYLAKK